MRLKHKRSLYRTIATLVDRLVQEWCALPNGYATWHLLPAAQRSDITLKWRQLIFERLMPQSFTDALLLACLRDEGKTDAYTADLYAWAIEVMYGGNETRLYYRWHQLMRMRSLHDEQQHMRWKPAPVSEHNPLPAEGYHTDIHGTMHQKGN